MWVSFGYYLHLTLPLAVELPVFSFASSECKRQVLRVGTLHYFLVYFRVF